MELLGFAGTHELTFFWNIFLLVQLAVLDFAALID
jgi:hypothetical protein